MAVSLPTICIKNVDRESYTEFTRKFSNFLVIHKVKATEREVQLAYLKSAIDSDISLALDSVEIAAEDTIDTVLEKLGTKLLPKSNIVLDQYRFLRRVQHADETFNEYLYEMKKLAKNCDLGNQLENLLKVQLVIGVNDPSLQERLLRNPELSLTRVIEHCQDAENAKKSRCVLQEDKFTNDAEVHSLNKRQSSQKFTSQSQDSSQFSNTNQNSSEFDCSNCGTTHARRKCPAYGKQCGYCKQYNHFKSNCRKLRNRQQTASDVKSVESIENQPEYLISELSNKDTKSWKIDVMIMEKTFSFKIDSGAELNILPLSILNVCNIPKSSLQPVQLKLTAFGGFKLVPLGSVTLDCKIKNKHCKICFVVLDDFCQQGIVSILGVQTCEDLELIIRVFNIVNYDKDHFLDKYQTCFTGLGKFDSEYDMRIDEAVEPIVNPPRRVPQTVMPKLDTALKELVKAQIIEPVDYPKNWSSNIVIVEKSENRGIRICLDPVHLNKVIKREYLVQ
uniref:Uncharacterized protein K02A2.6 n=1 Tax=Cacopsylla melanoneura TaxID=428564 RepID=A0A8D8XDC2_9HEMI